MGYRERLEEVARKIASSGTTKQINEETKNEDPDLMSLDQLMSTEFPESKWVIEKLIPHQGITIIAGSAGNFKTWIMLSMAKCITGGEDFLEKFPSAKSGVLIVDEENHPRLIKERLELLGTTKGLPIFWLSQKGFLVEKDEWISRILNICESKNLDVIFFDSLIRIHESDENAAATMSKVFRKLKRFCQAGKTVIITHHERKEGTVKSSGQNRLRGSSDISAAVDSHLTIKKVKNEKDKLSFEQPKLRPEQELDPFEVSILKDEEKISFVYKGPYSNQSEKESLAEELVLSVLSENSEGLSMKEIVEYIKKTESIGDKLIRKSIKKLTSEEKVTCRNGEKNEKICVLNKPDNITF